MAAKKNKNCKLMDKEVHRSALDTRRNQAPAVPDLPALTTPTLRERSDILTPTPSEYTSPGIADRSRTKIDVWNAGEVTVAEMRFCRDTAGPLSIDFPENNLDVLAVRALRRSDQTGLLGEEAVNFGSGEVHIYPFGQSFRSVATDLDQVTAYVPYDVVGYDPFDCPEHVSLAAQAPVGRLIKSIVFSVADGLKSSDPSDAAVAGEAIGGLIRGVVARSRDTNTSRQIFEKARAKALRSFVRQHICDPDLSVKKVCGAFGASRATIYREFEKEGGIANYILRQRLQRAMLDLAASVGRRGAVTEIALRYGFLDTSSFSRTFRRHFGVAPSDYVRQVSVQAA